MTIVALYHATISLQSRLIHRHTIKGIKHHDPTSNVITGFYGLKRLRNQ